MTEKWLEILIPVPVVAADLLCHQLNELDSVGVVVEERCLDTFIPPDPDETDGDTFLVKAYFADCTRLPQLRQQIASCLQDLAAMVPGLGEIEFKIAELGQQDWAEDWKQHFTTTHIGSRLVIKPSWEQYSPRAEDVVITIDPGMAFGTGTHGTTHLCLEHLAAFFDEVNPGDGGGSVPQRVLDVGTGSGILALAAAALGAQEVVACDIDLQACETARENIAKNGYSDEITVTSTLLEGLGYHFDIILANILAEENVRLAAPLVERLADCGTLILSGILDEKVALVTRAFSRFDLPEPRIYYEQEWACIVYTKVN